MMRHWKLQESNGLRCDLQSAACRAPCGVCLVLHARSHLPSLTLGVWHVRCDGAFNRESVERNSECAGYHTIRGNAGDVFVRV